MITATVLALAPLRAAGPLLAGHQIEPGVYVWDGLTRGAPLSSAIAAVDAAGFHAVRLMLSPQAPRFYSLPQVHCADGGRSLKCLFLSEGYQRALAVKSLNVVMFTAYDFASFGHQNYLNPEFLEGKPPAGFR